ncbi:MAG: DEAD/DEAH box helicase family protein, partial [Pseudomonadota bacterium]|nr:DEAD/DEAH box helicase family protein [Pseudomonadota bacterium]
MPTPPQRPLRAHQQALTGLVAAMANGEAPEVTDILAAVTPGGGKSLLPVIAAARLIEANKVERICWVVPRDSLRLQAEEAFADPAWRAALGHSLSVRAADNERNPSRGLAGYVTTYQAIAAAPDLHLAELRRHRTLLVVDEVHHLPTLGEYESPAPQSSGQAPDLSENASAWSRALLPLLESASLRLLLSGTLERADGRRILWLPYRTGPEAGTQEVDLDAPGWAVIGYTRAQAVAERAVLPVTFGALDGEASWLQAGRTAAEDVRLGPHRLSGPYPIETTRPALFTALRTGFARELLQEAFRATRNLRARRRAERELAIGETARGLGKLLVVAPDQRSARRYCEMLRGWMPHGQAEREVRLATSDERDSPAVLAAFRLTAEPAILVTVAMAYEGLDAPEVAVVAALTHIRSRPWLEQMIARSTRVDPDAGAYESQRALVFHPDDPLFARFRRSIEAEQGTLTRQRLRRAEAETPSWLAEHLAAHRDEGEGRGITPLESNALGLRFATLKPGPEFGEARSGRMPPSAQLIEPPSATERRLRSRIGEAVAAQAVEDEAGLQVPQIEGGLYHCYNAVLKRVFGGKGRAQMTLPELEASLAWLERNRLFDHLHLLEGDQRYVWSAARRRRSAWS